MRSLIIWAVCTVLFSEMSYSMHPEDLKADTLKRQILKAWNSEIFWKPDISLKSFEKEVVESRAKAAQIIEHEPLNISENTVFADFAEMSRRREFVRNQKDRSILSQRFYQLLDKLDINGPLFEKIQSGEFSNFFNAYVAMVHYRAGKAEPTIYDLSKYALNHLNNEELKTTLVAQNIFTTGNYHMMDSSMTDLIREVNRLSKDEAFKKKVNEHEARYSVIMAGKPVPDFELPDQHGKLVKLSDFKGKAVIIDMWATWCSVCIKEMPYFDAFREEMKDRKDIVFMSVGWEQTDAVQKWRDFVAERKLQGIQLISVRTKDKNEKDNLEDKFRLHVMPRYIFIDKQGRFVDSYGPYPSKPGFKEMMLKTIGN